MAKYTPYRKAAAAALMSWNGLSEAEAEAKIKSESYDELEGQVWASGSMKYAVQGLAKELSLTPEEATLLEQVVLGKNSVELSEKALRDDVRKRLIDTLTSKNVYDPYERYKDKVIQ